MESSSNVNVLVAGLTERWWALVIRGIAAVMFGIIAFARPGSTLLALVYVWGAYAIIDGVMTLVLAVHRGRAGLRWGWLLFEGIVGIAAGVLAFVWPAMAAWALLMVIGAWAVLTGIAEIAVAIQLRRVVEREWLLALSGLLSIAFGVLLAMFPLSGAQVTIWLIGGYAIAFGILLIALGMRLHRWGRTGERPFPTGGLPTRA